MKEIKINRLLQSLGKPLQSFVVETLLNDLAVKRRPYLDESDTNEGRYSQWLPIKRLGLELEFKSEAIIKECDEDRVQQTPLVLDSYIFYAQSDEIRGYAYTLPYGLQFDDTPQRVREKMLHQTATFKEYIRDVWDFGDHLLIVGYDEMRASITNIAYMRLSNYTNPTPTPFDMKKAVYAIGNTTESKEIKELCHFFDLDDFLGAQEKCTPRYLAKEYGLSLHFHEGDLFDDIQTKERVFSEMIFYDKCYLDFSHGYNGTLPFGLEFGDAPYAFVQKVEGEPVEIFEHPARMEGDVLWVFSTIAVRVVYSLLTNALVRVHVYPAWYFSHEDRLDWELDKETLLYQKLFSTSA